MDSGGRRAACVTYSRGCHVSAYQISMCSKTPCRLSRPFLKTCVLSSWYISCTKRSILCTGTQLLSLRDVTSESRDSSYGVDIAHNHPDCHLPSLFTVVLYSLYHRMPPPIEWKKRRPNMHTSRRAWEKSWDDDLDRNWELFGVYDADLWAYFTPESRKNATTTMNDDPRVLKLAGEEDTLCELQVSLAQEAGARFTRDDFENKWRTMDLQKREEIVLGGIYETMTAPGDWEESRRWVPESTLTNLTRDNGEGFLRLVQALMPSALDEPLKEPIFVPHPIVDRVLTPRAEAMSIPGYKSLFRSYQIKRANFLAMLVFNIFYLYVRLVLVSSCARSVLIVLLEREKRRRD